MRLSYDVVVVGGGHAGVEAAAAAARAGVRTVLVSADLGRLGQMSCNPAVGGVAKGVVAREVDALGGVMGRATDASRIHFRMLNRSKGPAVWGPRAQCDRTLYHRAVRRVLEEVEGLDLLQDMVVEVMVEGGRVGGVRCRSGMELEAEAVVVAAGTYLRGRIHIGGEAGVGGGRAGEPPALELAESLERLGLRVARFKTGTPPRVDGRTVDLDVLERQDGDGEEYRFASYAREAIPEQRPCWITWAGEDLKRIVRENLQRSALYGGAISGRGPRYCPSIEDKVVRFPSAPRHQVFLEPEGLDTSELYVNGLSTSLPAEVQLALLRALPGMSRVRMTRAGYAIEYDYFAPQQLRHTLEVKEVRGLFLAGQVNGTTGYEEAAAQGLVAGINAALQVRREPPLILERNQAYIGVLVDDLVTRGVDEPYRLFTSRAEYRLLLRQDNALRRLGPLARERGLLTQPQVRELDRQLREQDEIRVWFQTTVLSPEATRKALEDAGEKPLTHPARAGDLLRRPRVKAEHLLEAGGRVAAGFLDAVAAVEMEWKYEGYIAREEERARRVREQANFLLDNDLPYMQFVALSFEAREKLSRMQPATLAQAARIPGVSPADLQSLILEVRRFRAGRESRAS